MNYICSLVEVKSNSAIPPSFVSKLKANLVEYGPLFIILAAAFALRLVLFTGIVRNDDLDYLHYAQDINLGQIGIREALSEPFEEIGWRFGFYLPVVVLYHLFGPSQITTIAFPLISSLLGVLFVYLIGEMLYGKNIGLLAGYLWAIFPLDVHLATDLMPDGPMTAFSIGTVYFYLRATRSRKINGLSLAMSGLLLIWAVFIKPWALVTFFFLVVWWVISWFSKKTRIVLLIRSVKNLPRIYHWLAVGLVIVIFGTYLSMQTLPIHISFLWSSQDLLELFFGIRPNRFRPIDNSYPLVTPLTPLFAIATVFLLLKNRPGSKFLLTWAAFTYAYLEWGPRGISLQYSPTVPLAEARNLMLVFVPLVIIASTFLIKVFSQKAVPWIIPGCAIFAVFLAIYVKNYAFVGRAEIMISIGFLISVIGAFFLPGVSKLKNIFSKQLIGILFVCGLSIALLNPSFPDHFTEPRFVTQSNLQANLKPIVEYLTDHPNYSIITFSDDTALNLNYVSKLTLGFRQHAPFTPGLYRIVEDVNAIQRQDSFYVVFYSDYRGAVPADWWKIMELNKGLTFPVYLFRHLSIEDAKANLGQNLVAVKKEPVPRNYYELFGAAQNAHDLAPAFDSWINLREDPVYRVSLEQLQAVTFLAIEENSAYLDTNLLRNSRFDFGFSDWQIGRDVQVSAVTDGLKLNFTEQLQDFQGIGQTIELEANSLYYFTIRLKSSVSTSVFGIVEQEIETSLQYKDIYGEFTELSGIFVTPAWVEGPRRVEIVVASGRQIGSITVNFAGLYKVAPTQ